MFQLQQVCSNYNIKISVQKTKIMASVSKYTVRTKSVLNNKIIQQMSVIRYLGCDIIYDVNYDVDHKLDNFQSICGTIRQVLSRKTRKQTRLNFYKVVAYNGE